MANAKETAVNQGRRNIKQIRESSRSRLTNSLIHAVALPRQRNAKGVVCKSSFPLNSRKSFCMSH
ncbi:hypothetical protein Bca4012_087131 [Brassica carinata]|uniref:Uncharacterized protein n=3 Tax=Brassica TaxID=3705 RepID=A0A8S9SIA0_BRACR|nr:hypothetical protein F2Q69_00033263 [Brassica cretica]KAG2249531.1 hypothetical protein Bca52824_089159 [Brassica carinata]CAF2069232.1 unnamed protein product [Brassica napus]